MCCSGLVLWNEAIAAVAAAQWVSKWVRSFLPMKQSPVACPPNDQLPKKHLQQEQQFKVSSEADKIYH